MREFAICTGNSRTARVWHGSKITFNDLYEKLRTPMRTAESVEQYRKMGRGEKDEAKDKGGFMAGTLKGTRRRKEDVISRSIITLDADRLSFDFFETYTAEYQSIVYTTHSHTPDRPRARLLIMLSRDVDGDEYNAVARYLAKELGIEMFDPVSFNLNQLMYWPTCPSDGEYVCNKYDGECLNPDVFLKKYPDWRNVSGLPQLPEERKLFERQMKNQEDPLSKDGIVGSYCRTYGISDVMGKELSDVYEPTVDEARYHYIESGSAPGVVVYDDKFAYSHHASDPAYGRLLNAFDLVRIHKFGDGKSSFKEMSDYASRDSAVRTRLLEEKQREAGREFKNWQDGLQYDKNGAIVNNLHNLILILEHDENLQNIGFNIMADSMEINGKVPWEHPAKFWRDADDAQLICYIDAHYGNFAARNYQVAVTKVADDKGYHPIRDFLSGLPSWDGVKRVETLLIDYLGAEDNDYVRAVTRKALCAAVARVYEPGVKFDNILVLNGPQGIGKSTLVSKLGGEWYSDSLTLTDMNDKTAAEKLQGYWIMEIGELAGMRKADVDRVKAFISRRDDKYRASFGRRVTPHPRQCIFFGTTNAETGYLRDITGNRRFWTVKTPGSSMKQPWDLGSEDIRQIWAEALELFRAGEDLFLASECETEAKKEQKEALETDDREGLVNAYLDILLPKGWENMDLYRRREFLEGGDNPMLPPGTILRLEVCNMEIWCECFGKRKEDLSQSESYKIASIMAKLDGWEKSDIRKKFTLYGRQRIYIRKGQRIVP